MAGLLAGILPGAGHLYTGKLLQALTAFALNGAFLAGAAYAIHEKPNITGAILLFFETGWYLGGIHSAREAAREAHQQQQVFAEYLKAAYALPVLTFQVLQTPGAEAATEVLTREDGEPLIPALAVHRLPSPGALQGWRGEYRRRFSVLPP